MIFSKKRQIIIGGTNLFDEHISVCKILEANFFLVKKNISGKKYVLR